jgi:integrase
MAGEQGGEIMSRRITMKKIVQTYLEHRRSLGFVLNTQGFLLNNFAEWLDRSGRSSRLTTQRILCWVNQVASQNYRRTRLSVVRSFARHLAAQDSRHEVPDRALLPGRRFYQRPHLYSTHDIDRLLDAASAMTGRYPLQQRTYHTLFGLLACTGLRISEALKLTCSHVDLSDGILRIECTKFKKSRLVPLHPTATRALRKYAMLCDAQWGRKAERFFFVGRYGRALPKTTVRHVFRQLRVRLGWHTVAGECRRPRIHDLRHTFACRRLLRWYQRGQNVHRLIVALSTYLGHGSIADTYWYLTGTPELMAIAASRFERFTRQALGRQP